LRPHHTRARHSKRFRPDLFLRLFVENRFGVFSCTRSCQKSSPDWRPCAASARNCVSTLRAAHAARMTELSGARYRAGSHYRQQFVYNVPSRARRNSARDRKSTRPSTPGQRASSWAPVSEFRGDCSRRGPPLRRNEIRRHSPRSPYLKSGHRFLAVAAHLGQRVPRLHRRPKTTSTLPAIARSSLPLRFEMVRRRSLFHGNDSGPPHGGRFRVPSVVIFGPSDPAFGDVGTTGEGWNGQRVSQVLGALQRLRVPV
jgi:hypothetical protein